VELGCPSSRLPGMVREFADHYEDLKQNGLTEGLLERDAEVQAQKRIGDSIFLAEQTVAVLRRSSWWGRHPVIGFCVLPFFALPPAWALCGTMLGGFCWLLGRIFGPAYSFDRATAHALASDPETFHTFATPLNNALTCVSILLITFVFLSLVSRAALGLKWKLITCAICGLNSFVCYATIDPNSVFVGYGCPSPNWIYTAIPLLAAVVALFRQRTMENQSSINPHENPIIHSF
jgi:hypothetical protein